MKPLFGIIALLMLVFCLNAEAYQHKKAILMVEREAQVDTLGYNFVTDLSKDVYGWIRSGEVILWDSPERKVKLSYNDLQGVELRTQSFFKTSRNVYIYEYWTSDKKKTSFTVDGIYFTGSNYKGIDVIFGFVEFKGPLKELFENTPIHVNANGYSGATLYSVLMNKSYQYTLIYFDNFPVVKFKTSRKIVATAFYPNKQVWNYIETKPTKLVEYGWDSLSDDQMAMSQKVETALNVFFNSNRQEFLNLGGDKIYSFLKDAPVSISNIHVIEIWTKDKDGNIFFTPQLINLYVNGFQLQPVSFDKLETWKILMKDESLTAFLSAKDYQYTLLKINDSMIPYPLAQSYKDALFANSWNHILIKNQ